jgi:uncharacterized membrane protein YgaE (UPF0421/DUF939 family)
MSIDMSWPIRLRAMSFAITMGVTLTESVMGSIPIGLALWYFHLASTRTILAAMAALVAAVSLSISIYSHVRPARLPRSMAPGGAA